MHGLILVLILLKSGFTLQHDGGASSTRCHGCICNTDSSIPTAGMVHWFGV